MMPRLITILTGGTGSVKLVRGLAKTNYDLTVISNVGDNLWLYGLYICPDIDTVTYGLAGLLDKERGWGIRGDTFSFIDQMKAMGNPAWFGLGDRDLAIHVYRTTMLRQGKTLTEVTDTIAQMLGTRLKILPATDDEVATFISTTRGEMHLQDFWVRYAARPKVIGVSFRGAEHAKPTKQVLNAIKESKIIIIAPANPVSSIGPMLAMDGLRRELEQVKDRVMAVSPVIGRHPVSGPAAKYMRAVGMEVSPIGVARYYKDIAGSLVISKTDWQMAEEIEQFGMAVMKTNIMMTGLSDEMRLAKYLAGKVQN